MGHRAEKQMYGSMKRYRVAKLSGATIPRWQPPKRSQWKPRHVKSVVTLKETPHVPYRDLYHVKHSCGHDAYWNNHEIAKRIGAYPCAWCGGEHGLPIAITQLIIVFGPSLKCFKSPEYSETLDDVGTQVTVHHVAGDRCCV